MCKRVDNNERLTILSEAEKTALYGIPDFDDFQRVEFFAMTDTERSLALGRKSFLAQAYSNNRTKELADSGS
jgi:hypothetical protein